MVARHRPGWMVPVLPHLPRFGWAGRGSSSLPTVCLLAFLAFAGALFFQPTVVDGSSMAPTLHTGQVVWTDRAYYWRNPPQAGEVVVFRHGGETYIKRVYGLPGQTLYWIGDENELMRPLRSAQVDKMRQRWHGFGGLIEKRVPVDHVFVLGDNAPASVDSRHFGAIPIRELIGRVRLPADARHLTALEYTPPPPPSRARRHPSAISRIARGD